MPNSDHSTAWISNLQHFSTGDGPGIRTTVFFQGCALHCAWCHNPETISSKSQLLYYEKSCQACSLCSAICPAAAHTMQPDETADKIHRFRRERCRFCGLCARICPAHALTLSGQQMTLEAVYAFIEEDRAFYDSTQGGVTLSGGEPLLQPAFCGKLAQKCSENGIPVIIDTSGAVPYEAFTAVLPYTDTFYYDLKAASEQDYTAWTGGSLTQVLENLKKLHTDGGRITVRIPIIPGYQDTPEYCGKMAALLTDAGIHSVHLLPFHRLGFSKYRALGLDNPCADLKPSARRRIEALRAAFPPHMDVAVED